MTYICVTVLFQQMLLIIDYTYNHALIINLEKHFVKEVICGNFPQERIVQGLKQL